MSETVTVSAETPILQTDRTDTGRIIESKMVTEIPLGFNRNFQGLLVTVPGATRPFRPHSQFFNSQDALGTEVNGQPRMANNTLIEGLDNNHKTGLMAVIIPAADALETVSVSTSNYDAEFGRSGGAVTNVTLKSGTNDLKGSAFFFGNTEATNAERLLHAPEAADEVRAGRLHARRADRPQPALLLRRLPADHRQPRLRRARHRADHGDAQRRLQRGRQRHLRSADGRRERQRAHRVRQQPDPAGPDQPDRAPAVALIPEPNIAGRAARPEQLPEGAGAREDDRRLRHEGQLHAERQEPGVGPRQLPAPGRLRSWPVRRSSAARPTTASPAPARTRASAPPPTGRASSARRW